MMGGLVSRRKRAKVEASSVSTQVTECNTVEPQVVECQPDVATDATFHTEKVGGTELCIGDGLTSAKENKRQHYPTTEHANTENRKGNVLPKVKIRPRSSKKRQAERKDFSTQYDFLGLPGQVSPAKENITAKTTTSACSIQSCHNDPNEPVNQFYDTRPETSTNDCLATLAHTDQTKQSFSPAASDESGTTTKKQYYTMNSTSCGDYEDENSNIVQPSLYACSRDDSTDKVNATQQVSAEPPSSPKMSEIEDKHSHQDHPTQIQDQPATFEFCGDSEIAVNPLTHQSNNKLGLRLSLQGIYQNDMHCSGEVMEVAEVTESSCILQSALPQPTGNQDCWNDNSVLISCADSCQEGVKMDIGSSVDVEHSHPGQMATLREPQTNQSGRVDDDSDDCREEDIVEDTLDWNVDDRVRSPSDTRSDNQDSSDDDGVDILKDCAMVGELASAELHQNGLTLNDGDSAVDSVNLWTSTCETAQVSTSNETPKDLTETEANQNQSEQTTMTTSLYTAEIDTSNADTIKDSLENSTYHKQHYQSFTDEARDEGLNMSTGNALVSSHNEYRTPQDMTDERPNSQNDGTASEKKIIKGKVTLDKCGKIIMDFDERALPLDIEQSSKSILEMQETEAMTLLLLTGTLPGESNGSSVTRGAGDALNLDATNGTDTTADQTADEREGIATMLNTRPKSSCQLEQLQVEHNQPENQQNTTLNSIQSLQNVHSTTNNGSAADIPANSQNEQLNSIAISQEANGSSIPGCPLGQLSNVAQGAAAAASLNEENVADNLSLSLRPASPGAASSEGDWELIPLHRVQGHTNLGGLAACASSVPCGRSHLLPVEHATEQHELESDEFTVGSNAAETGTIAHSVMAENVSFEDDNIQTLSIISSGEPGQLQLSSQSEDILEANDRNEEKPVEDTAVDEKQTELFSREREGGANSPRQRRTVAPTLQQIYKIDAVTDPANAIQYEGSTPHKEQGTPD